MTRGMTNEEAIGKINHVKWAYAYESDYEAFDMAIEALQDRPQGEWVLKEHLWECDQCGCKINRANPLKGNIWNYNFCPNCGARMYRGDSEA